VNHPVSIQSKSTDTDTHTHAIVIGGSIAGLTSARVLADHFDLVTVIERDLIPETPAFRKGVPQGRQPHALLLRGQLILEQLFPGLTQELLEAGAVTVNMGAEIRWSVVDQMRLSYDSEIDITSCSRPLLEGTIYRHVLAHPKIHFIQQSQVIGLETDASGTFATGVRLRALNGDHRLDTPTRTITADLVVDASGRDSDAPQWLEALGFSLPQETVISSNAGYATRIYRRPAHAPADVKAIYIQSAPPHNTRGGIILPMEGDRWHVTMIGMAGDVPPTDEAGYLEFARSLPSPVLYEAIADAEPLTSINGYRRVENRDRSYEQLSRYLEGFVVLGDAARAFNPVYGQGMTVAAISSQVLDQCLREQREQRGAGDLSGLARRFQAQLAEATTGPWQMSTGEDRRWAALRGDVTLDPAAELAGRYVEQVIKASLSIPAVAEAFYRVQQMMDDPSLFFRPDIVLMVFGSLPSAEAPAELRRAA
jgi:2-polyprenyl-6-methoxyphenol hydroxylase-like FAD-dependent oxidoreductase